MLYLNEIFGAEAAVLLPFNFNKCCIWMVKLKALVNTDDEFNFNKCCIWMRFLNMKQVEQHHLTLTSVVFEF